MFKQYSFNKLLSILAFAIPLLWTPQAAFSWGSTTKGTTNWGAHHHHVYIDDSWLIDDAVWNADSTLRTVSLTVSTSTCTFTDKDFNLNGIEEETTNDTLAATGDCSLNFTFTIPNTASQLSGIQCNSDVRTYTAYCEDALFNEPDNGMTGQFVVNSSADPNMSTILAKLGCNMSTPCTFDLGSLPTKSKGQNLVLDTSKFGCQLAFPAATVQLSGSSPVDLQTNQLMKYSEQFVGGSGNCTTGTITPFEQAARICVGEADAGSVSDCNQIGTGNSTDYHVLFQQNLDYLFTVSRFESVQQKIQDNSACNNSGVVKFIIYGEDGFDVTSIDGISPFDPSKAPTLQVVGATTGPAHAVNVFNPGYLDADGYLDLPIQYDQCDLGTQINSIPGYTTGDIVRVEIYGHVTGADNYAFHAFVDVGTN